MSQDHAGNPPLQLFTDTTIGLMTIEGNRVELLDKPAAAPDHPLYEAHDHPKIMRITFAEGKVVVDGEEVTPELPMYEDMRVQAKAFLDGQLHPYAELKHVEETPDAEVGERMKAAKQVILDIIKHTDNVDAAKTILAHTFAITELDKKRAEETSWEGADAFEKSLDEEKEFDEIMSRERKEATMKGDSTGVLKLDIDMGTRFGELGEEAAQQRSILENEFNKRDNVQALYDTHSRLTPALVEAENKAGKEIHLCEGERQDAMDTYHCKITERSTQLRQDKEAHLQVVKEDERECMLRTTEIELTIESLYGKHRAALKAQNVRTTQRKEIEESLRVDEEQRKQAVEDAREPTARLNARLCDLKAQLHAFTELIQLDCDVTDRMDELLDHRTAYLKDATNTVCLKQFAAQKECYKYLHTAQSVAAGKHDKLGREHREIQYEMEEAPEDPEEVADITSRLEAKQKKLTAAQKRMEDATRSLVTADEHLRKTMIAGLKASLCHEGLSPLKEEVDEANLNFDEFESPTAPLDFSLLGEDIRHPKLDLDRIALENELNRRKRLEAKQRRDLKQLEDDNNERQSLLSKLKCLVWSSSAPPASATTSE